jgi:transcriptional regulator with XRE-family HTH domain
MNLTIRILRARKDKHISQKETARLMGISRSALAQWEASICNPSVKNLSKLSEVLDVSFEWLATGKGEKRRSLSTEKNMNDAWLEKEIIQRLKLLPSNKKRAILSIVASMVYTY